MVARRDLVGVTVLELEVAGWPWACPGFNTPFDSSSSSDERLANLADKSSDARFILTTGETGGPEVKRSAAIQTTTRLALRPLPHVPAPAYAACTADVA